MYAFDKDTRICFAFFNPTEKPGFAVNDILVHRGGIHGDDGEVMGSMRLILGEKSLLPYVIEARNFILATILVLTAVLTALIIYFSRSQIANPLKILTAGAEKIGQGQLDHRIAIDGEGEVGTLAKAFNSMAANLEASTREIIREREYIRSIVDSITEGIIVVDCEERITSWNQVMERRYGMSLEKVLGGKLVDVFPDLYTPEFQDAFSGLLEGEKLRLALHKVTLKGTPDRVLALTGSPLQEGQDQVNGAAIVF